MNDALTDTTLKTEHPSKSTSRLAFHNPFSKKVWALLLLVLALLIVFLLSLVLGSVNIPFDQVITILLGGEAEKSSWVNIVIKFRLPRALTAVLAGGALSIAGLLMQTFFRNPLAGPFTLGISSGASLGVALVVLSFGTVGGQLLAGFGLQGDLILALAASAGAALSMLLVLFMARQIQSSMTLLILGLMFSYMTGAGVSLLMFFAIPERIQAYVNWTFGSFNSVTGSQIPILAVSVGAGLLICILIGKSLNALLLGEAYAQSMGINILRLRLYIVLATATLAGAVIAFCGPISFIGIAVPHLSRALFNTSDHRLLLPVSLIIGALVGLLGALIAEVPGSNLILPLNAVMAMIGAPILIWVILRQRNLQKAFAS
ncbi:iron ABC transporter permease [Anaerolineales bacterium]